METLSGTCSYPAEAGDKNAALVDGDGEMLHGMLEGAFSGGNGVRNGKIFPSKEIMELKPSFFCLGIEKRGDFSAEDELSRV
jgi:hypothetical protein